MSRKGRAGKKADSMVRKTVWIFIFAWIWNLGSGFNLFAGANSNWGASNVQRKIAIQTGGARSSDIAVWQDSWRSNVTSGSVNMTAAGDGTYEYGIPLVRGATYNFIFYTRTNGSPPSGLNANSDYFDTVPNAPGTVMVTSGVPVQPVEPSTAIARLGGVGTGSDARRILTVPRSLPGGSTMWVYCNFASTPNAPTSFQAQAASTNSIQLFWGKPYGVWGSGGDSFAAADVIAAGTYEIKFSSSGASGPYDPLVTVPGSSFTYTHANLTPGQTYYYIIRSSDPYQGGYGSTNIENNFSGWGSYGSDVYAIPASPRKVRFKVEKIDWDQVEKKFDYLVWATPWEEDARNYQYKEPCRITRVYLPSQ